MKLIVPQVPHDSGTSLLEAWLLYAHWEVQTKIPLGTVVPAGCVLYNKESLVNTIMPLTNSLRNIHNVVTLRHPFVLDKVWSKLPKDERLKCMQSLVAVVNSKPDYVIPASNEDTRTHILYTINRKLGLGVIPNWYDTDRGVMSGGVPTPSPIMLRLVEATKKFWKVPYPELFDETGKLLSKAS